MSKIGFSTGVMYKNIDPVSVEMVKILSDIGKEAIEISLIGNEKIKLDEKMISELRLFENISIHAPCANIEYQDDVMTRIVLTEIKNICRTLPVKTVGMHPDLVRDWSVFQEFQIPIAIENMDHRKKFGKSVDDLKKVFAEIDCGFVLDINHAFSVDPSRQLTKNLINIFGDRLVEIHASGFTEYHEPLSQTDQVFLLDDICDLNVPVILEAVFTGKKYLPIEYDLVKKYLH